MFKYLLILLIINIFYWYRPNEVVEEVHVIQKEEYDGFKIKHIFHHGSGKNHNIHRRLDLTPEYIKKTGLDEVDSTKYHHIDTNQQGFVNIDAMNSDYDWPSSVKGNPWTMNLPYKYKKGSIKRLTERHTPDFIDSYLDYAMSVKGNPQIMNRITLDWEDEEVLLPDVNDKETLVTLALMSSNAYVKYPIDDDGKKASDWYDIGEPWVPDKNHSDVEFGWGEDGIRGHVFVNEKDKIIVVAIKGTSGAAIPGGGDEETTNNDRINDNLLFSCCCARVSYMWKTVCDCYEKAYTCNQDCLEKELMRKDRYYQSTLEIYRNVTEIYNTKDYEVWVTGHSLGGSLGSLLGRTYGLPVVAFEAPGEMLATKRLHLPQPPGYPKYMEHIYHIGNTADPIFMGVCNGVSSTCNAAGYAMETACHTGKLCVYDVVTDKGWSVNVLNHRIHTVIDEIIMVYNDTAQCVEQPPCRDCFNWRYVVHDDDENDEPFLPNPLKPHKSKTKEEITTTSSSVSSKPSSIETGTISSETSEPSEPPKKQKCLKRTWYGWCSEWGEDPDV
ncbi:putative lipase Atg15p [[Candida] jaroonii]|uniref:Lipase Atg15p n=1 Tax=[Candida] jaroonii TaxID=467808 RepID=A0ACA9Y0Y3_9ASCO|nr:putative lipase Atg15p [[Candida] jaroonii]